MAKHVLSIEIGQQVTKIVEIDYKKKNPHVYRAVTFATPEDVIEDGVIRDKDTLAVAFRNELAEAGMNEKSVVFSIASSKIATREVTLPNVKENKIGAVIQANAQDYFPIDLTDYTLAYTLLETIKEGKSKSYKVLCLAAPDSLVDNYYNFAREMGFNIESLDYFGNGSMQVLKKEIVLDYCACIQISGNTTMINFMNEGQQLMQRTIPMGVFNVAEAMVLSDECLIDDMDSACEALCRDRLVCKTLDYEGLEEVGGARMTDEQWRQMSESQSARKVVTDAVGEILLSVLRVLDFFRSKNQGIELTSIYITGMGCKVAGIDELFSNELHIPTHRMEHLVNVSFPRQFTEGLYNQTEYIAVVGAAMAPVGFKSKDASLQQTGSDGMQVVQLVFGLSIVLAVVAIGWSIIKYQDAKTDNEKLISARDSLKSIEQIYNENTQMTSVFETVDGIYNLTQTHNENLNDLINYLEGGLPKTMKVTYLQSSDEGISMTIESENDISIARMLMNLEQITEEVRISETEKIDVPILTNISIPSVVATDISETEKVYSFSVTADYNPELSADPDGEYKDASVIAEQSAY